MELQLMLELLPTPLSLPPFIATTTMTPFDQGCCDTIHPSNIRLLHGYIEFSFNVIVFFFRPHRRLPYQLGFPDHPLVFRIITVASRCTHTPTLFFFLCPRNIEWAARLPVL
jgi:hypothetical protein